jgi:HK97 family phage portal protein
MKVFSFTEWMASGGSFTSAGTYRKQSYKRVGWVYAAVNRIALTASSAPLIFYQGKPDEAPTYDAAEIITQKSHPVLKLFSPPKFPIILSLRDLLFRTFLHLGIDGKVFWVIERSGGVPVNINLFGKDRLAPLLRGAAQDELVGWTDTTKGKNYKLEDVLLIQEYNPMLDGGLSLDGLSPLEPARLSLDAEFHINGWNTSYFKTGMKSPLLLQARGMLTKDQKADIRKEIINYYSGVDGAHGALLLQGGIEVTPLTVGSKDVDFIQGKKLNREEILGVYGVPPSLVGLFEYSSYANAEEQTKTFWEQTLLPKMAAILDLIQINILDVSFPGVYAAWDTSKVAGLRPNPVTLAAPVKTYMDMGYHPIQIAKIVGMPSLVPDKSFDKLRIQRQQQQLEYQRQLMEQSQQYQKPQEQEDPKDQPKKPPKKPKKDIGSLTTLLSSKLSLFAKEKAITDESFHEDLWNVIVRSFVVGLLHDSDANLGSVISVFDSFRFSSSEDLLENSNDIAKIFITGIYNPEKRH